jgi:hypothetical protein
MAMMAEFTRWLDNDTHMVWFIGVGSLTASVLGALLALAWFRLGDWRTRRLMRKVKVVGHG